MNRILAAAAGAVDAHPLVERASALLPPPPAPLFVVAAGKAAWSMAAGLHPVADRVATGLVAGPRRAGLDLLPGLEHFDAGHPAPDAASERAARRALEIAVSSRSLGGALLVLLSGGASAMLAAPARGMLLEHKSATAAALMLAGVPIEGLNCVRKHLSAIKGGRLAAAAGDTVTLAISDVHGPPVEDDPAVIGSGPTVADPTTYQDACDVIARSGVTVPDAVIAHLRSRAATGLDDTPKPGDQRLARGMYHVLANRRTAMAGAAAAARALGYAVEVIAGATFGEAREASRGFATAALGLAAGRPGRLCVIGSGEPTVQVRGEGRGGRNQEFVLAAAPYLEAAAASGAHAVLGSAGTDGIDGPTPAAGAVADWATITQARARGLSAPAMLSRNASYDFFLPLGDLITWGPTGTNVGDIHVMLIDD